MPWINARYASYCHECSTPIDWGDRAFFDGDSRTIYCQDCGEELAEDSEDDSKPLDSEVVIDLEEPCGVGDIGDIDQRDYLEAACKRNPANQVDAADLKEEDASDDA